MNLIIDVGNTLIKLAVFNGNLLLSKKSCVKNDFLEVFAAISEEYKSINDVIVSSVGDFSEEELSEIRKKYNVVFLSHKDPVPFVNKYATPTTLGIDRIALMSSAAIQFPKKNVLVIDVGSCVTYDFLNSKNEYFGGAISPGIDLRFKSLHSFTDKLPLLKPKKVNSLIGDSTENSMQIGVLQGLVFEIEGFISSYKEKHKELTIILTGGGAHYLVDSLKNDIFANSNFLLEGLNCILENKKTTC